MSDVEPVDFVAAIQDQAEQEAGAVVQELGRVRLRADRVVQILNALQLPVPTELEALLSAAKLPAPAAPRPPKPQRQAPLPAVPPAYKPDQTSPPENAPEPESAPSAPEMAPAAPAEPSADPGDGRVSLLIAPAPESLRSEQQIADFLTGAGGDITSRRLQELWPWAHRTTAERVIRHFYEKGFLTLKATPGRNEAATYQVGGANIFASWPRSSKGWKRQPAWTEVVPKRRTLVSEVVARQQDAILAVMEELRENLVPREVTEELVRRGLEIPQARVGDYVRDMAAVGVLERTGVTRRADTQSGGRTSIEYCVPGVTDAKSRKPAKFEGSGFVKKREAAQEDVPAPRQRPFPGGQTDAGDEPAPVEPERERTAFPEFAAEVRLKHVRDHVLANRQHTHTAMGLHKLLDITEEEALEALAKLASQGVIKPKPTGGYVYDKPTDAGTAARMSQSAPPGRSQGGAAPVAGTGKPQKATNKDVADIIKTLRGQGLNPKLVPSGHWEVQAPQGRILISNTPSSKRTVENDRVRLRRAGVAI